jgi:hypothetical protein
MTACPPGIGHEARNSPELGAGSGRRSSARAGMKLTSRKNRLSAMLVPTQRALHRRPPAAGCPLALRRMAVETAPLDDAVAE